MLDADVWALASSITYRWVISEPGEKLGDGDALVVAFELAIAERLETGEIELDDRRTAFSRGGFEGLAIR